jgi:hypothetical protein
MAGTRRARGDRQIRLAVGLAMLTISVVSILSFWPSRRHPFELVHTVGFWVDVAVVLISTFIFGTVLPSFQQPGLRILVGNEPPFRRNIHPTDTDLEISGHTDKSRVDVRVTFIRVVEQRMRWAERVRVEVIATQPQQPSHSGIECLNWYSKDSLQELADIAPGGEKWAELDRNIINEDDVGKSQHRGLALTDDYVAILAVSWNGKLLDAVKVKISGWRNVTPGDRDTGFATVEIIDRPKLRDVHKLNEKRIKARV